MNRKPEHHPAYPTESAVATCRDGEFGGRTALRRILSQLGLHADTTQEEILLELIHRSHCQKQYAHA
ncbi:MAG: hypothetical protein ACYS72_04375 [Planctomycetota bacterium]|jgi:hypothetical protein